MGDDIIMPTYRNNFYKEIMVGDLRVQGNSEFETSRYLNKKEMGKYISFVSDDPPISPVLYSFDEMIGSEHEITVNFNSPYLKFDFHINTEEDITMYFNSKNTYPVILKKGSHCFKSIKGDTIRRIIIVKAKDTPSNINGYMVVAS